MGISRLARGVDGELRGHRLPEHDGACLPQPADGLGVVRRLVAAVDRGPVCGGQVGRVDQILDADRKPVQRRPIAQGVDAPRFGDCGFCVERFPGLDYGLSLGDARKTSPHQLFGGDLAAGKLRDGFGSADHAAHQARASCV